MVKLSKSERRKMRRCTIEKFQSYVDRHYGKNLIEVYNVSNSHVYFDVYLKKFELPEYFAFKAHLSENEKGVVLNIYTGECEENIRFCKIEGIELMNDTINLIFEKGIVMENIGERYGIGGSLIEWKDDIYSIQLIGDSYYFPLDGFDEEMKAFLKPSDYDASSGLIER